MARLGQQVDVYCGTCKVDRYHTVAALKPDGSIARVQCGYCNSARNYKDPSTVRRTASARSSSPRSVREPEPIGPPRAYSPSETFEKGDVIEHVKYGRGKVADVRGDRIDVKFPDGTTRVFVHRPGA